MTDEERHKGSIWVRKLEAAMKTLHMQNKLNKAIDQCTVEKIKQMRSKGMFYSEIGERLYMSPTTARKYLRQEKAPSTTAMAREQNETHT